MQTAERLVAPRTGHPPRIAIGVVSAAALAYEVLLMRLFSIIQYHHFAYMIISLALLGYGASGTFLIFTRRRLLARFPLALIGNVLLFGLSIIFCYLVAQRVPFNPEEFFWRPVQFFRLLAVYLLLALPFFFAANSVALALISHRADIARLYGADLLGAGAGSLGIILLLFVVFPGQGVRILAALAMSAAAIAWWETGGAPRSAALLLALAVLFPFAVPADWCNPLPSPYKGLSQQLFVSGSRLVGVSSSPLGMLSVVENDRVPFRHAPGLSLRAVSGLPPQVAVFTDGDAMSVITRHHGDLVQQAYLDQLTSALPYHLAEVRSTLVLGAGGGSTVLQAKFHQVPEIDAVELNSQMVELVREEYGEFSGNLYRRTPGAAVRVHIAEARGFVTASSRKYDLIQLEVDSFSGSMAGLYGLSESYLYTIESLREYIGHLTEEGYLSVSRWLKVPPRDTLKLFATALAALEENGAAEPGRHLLLIRGLQTSTLLVKNSPVTGAEIEALLDFCGERSFDVVYYPQMEAAAANRYNVLQQPYFYDGVMALLGEEREQFIARYKYDITPATDDRPYFFNFFKWGLLPEIVAMRGRGGMGLLEAGYLVLVATMVQALIASLVLILLPLLFLRGDPAVGPAGLARWRVLVYFSCIGLAFLFLEIAMIQKFILFLNHPLYAVAVVLTSFLFFAGLGSGCCRRFTRPEGTPVGRPVVWIVILGLLYVLGLETLVKPFANLADPLKIGAAILLIAPLAFFMGMPFPLALALVGDKSPELIPWAWAVNGCASVLAAVLAALLAVHFGFMALVLSALLLYILAAMICPRRRGSTTKLLTGG